MKNTNKGIAGSLKDARQSLKEENKAVEDYDTRGKRTKDQKLKKIFKHTKKEEKEHVKMFSGFLRSKS